MGARALAVAIAAVLIFAMPAAAAPGDGVRVARDGDRLIVAGPPSDGVQLTVDEGAADGEILIAVAFPGRIESWPLDCFPQAAGAVRCPTWRSRVVAISLGDKQDFLN